MNEIEMEQQRQALELAKININDWNGTTPDERRIKYRKVILNALRENHPDKHSGQAENSAELKAKLERYTENTKLLNSISYDDAVRDRLPQSAADAFAPSSVAQPYPSPNSSELFTPPKNAEELVEGLNRGGYRPPHNGRYYPEPGYELNKGTDYYEAVKEHIPNILTWEQSDCLQASSEWCGSDLGRVTMLIATKHHLKDYRGADVLVSALVSQDETRIKDAFDSMISHLRQRPRFSFWRLFTSVDAEIAGFIDRFCCFKPKAEAGGLIVGINADNVRLVCQSLSLIVPDQIRNPSVEMEEERIRELLTEYVSRPRTTLQLEGGSPAVAP